ncbi:hypothetical protein TNCV_3960221 [Trichonephila clavipes]|nr:hypothetical protein TNCV_3960221 [Trichonephila clavipes]
MTVPVAQSVNRLCNVRFTVWVPGAVNLTKVPLLNARHRAADLVWTREHRDWSVEYWKRVALSDVSIPTT